MARPRKPDSELKTPRRLKTPDGKPLRPKGRPAASEAIKVSAVELKALINAAVTSGMPPPPTTVDAEPLPSTNLTPLEYALQVMNNPNEPRDRRDKLAIAALPFCHVKRGEGGKKEQVADNAEKAANGKFAQSSAPKLVVNNK